LITVMVLASGSRGNAYVVSDGATPLLLEAGIPLRQLRPKAGFKISALVGCLLSHEHLDHAKAAANVMRAGVDLWCSSGSAEALGLGGHRLHIARAKEPFTLGTWTILPFDTVHDAVEPLGFLLTSGSERLLYATDTAYIRYRFPGCTVMMLECNYDLQTLKANVESGLVPREVKRRVLRSHMSIDTLCGFLRANDLSRLREVWLLHLSDDSGDAEGFRRRVAEITGRIVRVA